MRARLHALRRASARLAGWRPSYWREPDFRHGVRDMLPQAPGIAAWGLMMGVTMVAAGLSPVEALAMTLLVFAGSSQMAATPLMVAGAPAWLILATAFCVNMRFVVFSLHLRPYLLHLPARRRLACGYLLADASYVLFIRRHPVPAATDAGRRAQQACLAGMAWVTWLSWMVPGVIGLLAADAVPQRWGLQFAGILSLLGILCSLASDRLRLAAALAAAAVSVAAYFLPLRLNIMLAIVAAVAVGLLLEPRPARRGGTPAP
jgi:predicted branched-subunit amino acid permease